MLRPYDVLLLPNYFAFFAAAIRNFTFSSRRLRRRLISCCLCRAMFSPPESVVSERWSVVSKSYENSNCRLRLPTAHSSLMICTHTVLSRGPSYSQKKIACQRPSCNVEYSMGSVSFAPVISALMCAALLPSS